MATSRTAKVNAEIEKVREAIAKQQGKLKDLEQKRTECENTEIVDIVRGLNIPLDKLATMLSNIKAGTSGQVVPKSAPPITENEPEDEPEDETEDETE